MSMICIMGAREISLLRFLLICIESLAGFSKILNLETVGDPLVVFGSQRRHFSSSLSNFQAFQSSLLVSIDEIRSQIHPQKLHGSHQPNLPLKIR